MGDSPNSCGTCYDYDCDCAVAALSLLMYADGDVSKQGVSHLSKAPTA